MVALAGLAERAFARGIVAAGGATVVSFAASTALAQGAPLSLEDAVRLALSRNERAMISDLNVVVADANVEHARAAFLPTLVFSGNDTDHPFRPAPARTANAQPNNAATGTLTLNQPIVNASAWPLYSQAKAQFQGQRAQTTDDKRLLAFDAARAFFNVLTAESIVAAAQRRLDSANADFQDTQARVQAQLSSSNDATRAEIDVEDAGRELDLDQGSRAIAFEQLAFVINANVASDVTPPDGTLQVAQLPVPRLDALAKTAISHRPDLVAKRFSADAAHYFADEPLLRLVPTLGVSAQTQALSNPGAIGRWHDESVAATLTWTLYDAGARYADKRGRDASASIADLNVRTLVRSVLGDVQTAVAALEAQQAAFRSAEKAAESSRRSAEETGILYKQGLAKAIELVDANDSRFLAEVNDAQAEYSLAQAYMNLRQALGLDPLGTELK